MRVNRFGVFVMKVYLVFGFRNYLIIEKGNENFVEILHLENLKGQIIHFDIEPYFEFSKPSKHI